MAVVDDVPTNGAFDDPGTAQASQTRLAKDVEARVKPIRLMKEVQADPALQVHIVGLRSIGVILFDMLHEVVEIIQSTITKTNINITANLRHFTMNFLKNFSINSFPGFFNHLIIRSIHFLDFLTASLFLLM